MARSRNIKPGFFLNDQLAECDPLARLLFAGLWCIADREGRLEDRPKRIKIEVLPYDNCDVDELLNQLAKQGFILRYEVGGNRYIQIVNFLKHQNPHKNEVKSVIPPPLENNREMYRSAPEISGEEQEKHSTNPADSLNLIPDSNNIYTSEQSPDVSPDTRDEDVPTNKSSDQEKVQFAEFVSMTNVEYQRLIDTYGEADTKLMIEKLNNYKGAHGKKYKSDYRAILSWVADEVMIKKHLQQPKQKKEILTDEMWKQVEEELNREQERKR